MALNPFSADVLSRYMVLSVDKSSDSQIADEFDLVALVVHAGMIAVGFRLVSLGEGQRKTNTQSDADDVKPLPPSWNQNDNSYAFTYAHSQSSMKFLVKVSRMFKKATVSGMGDGDDKHYTFDLAPLDHIRPSVAYPLRIAGVNTTTDGNLEDKQRELQNDVFQSPGRLSDIGVLLKQKIIQKLAPGISKAGYQEDAESREDRATDGARQGAHGRAQDPPRPQGDLPEPARPNPYPGMDPLAVPRPPRRDPGELYPPGFTDEYEINQPGRGGLRGGPPMGIGERDLYPPGLGPGDGMRPFFGPGHPASGGIGGGGSGGMHPTFDDPMFGGGGGGGYDPSAPPGARFDPVNPGQRGPPRGSGGLPGGGRLGGGPPNPFGGFGGNDFI